MCVARASAQQQQQQQQHATGPTISAAYAAFKPAASAKTAATLAAVIVYSGCAVALRM
jgi:hypothetical protein